jgi:hypothetical protein
VQKEEDWQREKLKNDKMEDKLQVCVNEINKAGAYIKKLEKAKKDLKMKLEQRKSIML